ncbi:protein of unknown function [Salipaludibacillus aurantiacus]|uniref:DUF4352 domain-containing protein n=2 Tax=Salipaludibacillus aurantiacus TaxID=1601833 RepID=A0A1H9X601_9BACI|nr:protein of unknown function [Salipaludibacillus aurantiacus]
MKKLSLSLLGLSVAMMLAACGESSIDTVEQDNSNENAAEASEVTNNEEINNDGASDNESNNNSEEVEEANEGMNEETVEEEDLGIGTTVDFNGLHVTLKEARMYEGDGDWETPDNDFFVILDVSIENTTDEEANISTMLQMDLVTPDGYSQDMDFMVDTRGSLDGEVGAGRTMAGEMSFDVEEAHFYEFIFEDPFKSGQAIWKIDRNELAE